MTNDDPRIEKLAHELAQMTGDRRRGGHSAFTADSSLRKKSRPDGGAADDVVLHSERPSAAALRRDGAQRKKKGEVQAGVRFRFRLNPACHTTFTPDTLERDQSGVTACAGGRRRPFLILPPRFMRGVQGGR